MRKMAILSQTPRDPFAIAQAQSEGRKLSQTPMPQGSPLETPQAPAMNPDFDGLEFNELGKVQLIGKLQARYGDGFQKNPEAMKAMSDFEAQMRNPENVKSMNQGLANANRTLAALFG
jgi:hypothetical protein